MRNVKSFFILLLTLTFIPTIIGAQRTQTAASNSRKSSNKKIADKAKKTSSQPQPPEQKEKSVSKADAAKAQAALDELKNVTDGAERIEKLNKFITDFPRVELKTKAIEMLVVSHVEAGEASFRGRDAIAGAEHFRAAAQSFEPTVSDGIFNDVIVKLPFNLFFRGERVVALEVAKLIEPKIKDNAPRLLALTNFYLATENADDARRAALRAAEVAPDSAAAQISLGMAHRIAFHLEASSQAYSRALELDPASIIAKRNLADAWRGLGQTDDALKLYRELVTADAADEAARNGLVLALLDAGNKDEAEKDLVAALSQNPKNLILQTGAAYWYAANGDGGKAIELASQAVATEPRYVWGQIALARGLILEKRPLEAERALLTAAQYGKFPTLDYELASAHFAAGLYAEAADDLRRSFALNSGGKLQTKLAGREAAEAENFNELLSRERRASIFEPIGASSDGEARQLKELLSLAQISQAENSDQNTLAKAAQDFAVGTDEMQVHRQLYAANKLLNQKIALDQVLEITQQATDGLEKSLDVPTATAAVLADELYEPRRVAATKGNVVNIPIVPRETLRQIMRGRVEEIAGWALYQQNKPEEAAVRLRRAVGVLPESSAWWRSSYWKLGTALDAAGKSKEALDAYLKSYRADVPSDARRLIVEGLYQRIYGSLDGFENALKQTDTQSAAITGQQNAPRPAPTRVTSASFRNPLPNVIAEILPSKPSETSQTETLKTETPPISETKTETPMAIAAEAKSENLSTVKPQTAPPETIVAQTSEAKSVTQTPQPLPTPEVTMTPETKVSEVAPKTKSEIKVEDKAKNELEKSAEDKAEGKAENKNEIVGAPSAVETPPIPESKEIKPDESLNKSAATPEIATEQATSSNENNSPEKKVIAQNAEENANPAFSEKTVNDSLFARPRVVIVPLNNSPASANNQTESETKPPGACVMQVNQSEFSILRNGGTLAFIVTFGNAADAAKLNVSVSSPSDLSVVLLPSDDTGGDHRLVQISSISEVTKIYTITLESPCGKEEVKIKVR